MGPGPAAAVTGSAAPEPLRPASRAARPVADGVSRGHRFAPAPVRTVSRHETRRARRAARRPVRRRTERYAIAAFVVALVGPSLIPFASSIAAIVLGVIALKRLRERLENRGEVFAVLGIVLGAIGLIGTALLFAGVFFV